MKKKYLILLSLIVLNIILIPKVHAYDSGREIYVRHIERYASPLINSIANATQEEVTAAGTSVLIPSGTSIDADMEYSEYYNIPIDSTMNLTKSLVLRVDGQAYKYLGYNVCTTNSLQESEKIANVKRQLFDDPMGELDVTNDSTDSTAQFIVKQANNNDVTIIDFYYTKLPVNEIRPNLRSFTDAYNSLGIEAVTDVTYVPAGARWYPYFETQEYSIKDLSYQKVIENGRISYKVKDLKAYMIEDSYVYTNNSPVTVEGKTITANIFGEGLDALADISGGRYNMAFLDQSKQAIEAELRAFKGVTLNRIPRDDDGNVSSGKSTNKSDTNHYHGYANGVIVRYKSLNGLRYCNGNVVYAEYDVMNETKNGTIEVHANNNHFVNVYTPIELLVPEIEVLSSEDIDHSSTSSSTIILPDDATFRMKFSCGDPTFEYYNNLTNEQKQMYIGWYMVMFDFPVIDESTGEHHPVGDVVWVPNTANKYNGYTYKTLRVDPSVSLSKQDSEHRVIVFALSTNCPFAPQDYNYNLPLAMMQFYADQEESIQWKHEKDVRDRTMLNDTGTNAVSFETDFSRIKSNNNLAVAGMGEVMYSDAYYAAMRTMNIKTVSKLYDFKISDCNDLAYKSVFRDSKSTNINEHSKYYFYSGIRRMVVYENNNKEYTTLINRRDEHDTNPFYINGTSATATLPLGPYKHTTASYVNAPKLGYRISYDVKTTGYYTPNGTRNVKITPSYYFISKDGAELIKEIDLYYKDSSGKYRKFEKSDYTIFFTPNDGYRFKNSSVTTNQNSISSIEQPLNIASSAGSFYLTDKMMTCDSANYTQCWYGEFKLPNTTVAVRKDDSLDHALSNGYIGVKFGIECKDVALSETLTYESEDKNATNTVNTTQWDYEGYLGFANPGQPVTENTSLRLQLEKGIWSISSQEVYEFVKGTVVLYDADGRAADDIQ